MHFLVSMMIDKMTIVPFYFSVGAVRINSLGCSYERDPYMPDHAMNVLVRLFASGCARRWMSPGAACRTSRARISKA